MFFLVIQILSVGTYGLFTGIVWGWGECLFCRCKAALFRLGHCTELFIAVAGKHIVLVLNMRSQIPLEPIS